VTVTFDTTTGISNGPSAKTVNGVDGFTKFAAGSTGTNVLREMATFGWEISGIDGKVIAKQEVFRAENIKMYTVLDIPKSPWDVADTTVGRSPLLRARPFPLS
jgi:hypothetical protein